MLGAKSIITGVSPEIAQTLVRIGIDVSKLQAVGDLQGGLEEANRILDVAPFAEREARSENHRGEK